MQLKMPVNPEWLRANVKSAGIGVDRVNKVIAGYVVAQEGSFLEPEPRGEFDEKSLRQIVALMKANSGGTKARLGHPTISDDGISKFMGRAKNPRLDSVRVMRDGEEVELMAVRADLHLSESAFETNPNGNIGEYILNRAEEDPDSFSSSLVLQVDQEWRLDNHKQPRKNDAGEVLPPLWRPLQIHASDIVDSGAAVNGFLSADGLPDAVVRQATELFVKQLGSQPREVAEARLLSWAAKLLNFHYGEPEQEQSASSDDGAALADYVLADELSEEAA